MTGECLLTLVFFLSGGILSSAIRICDVTFHAGHRNSRETFWDISVEEEDVHGDADLEGLGLTFQEALRKIPKNGCSLRNPLANDTSSQIIMSKASVIKTSGGLTGKYNYRFDFTATSQNATSQAHLLSESPTRPKFKHPTRAKERGDHMQFTLDHLIHDGASDLVSALGLSAEYSLPNAWMPYEQHQIGTRGNLRIFAGVARNIRANFTGLLNVKEASIKYSRFVILHDVYRNSNYQSAKDATTYLSLQKKDVTTYLGVNCILD